jgi:orotate phosphoribosyltransferase
MSEQYSLLTEFDNAFEAELAKGLLEENGIPVRLNNELINSIYPTFAGDMFRLELWVPMEQMEIANDILETYTDNFFTYRLLKEADALLEGHFLLTSGRHSTKYIEKIKILQSPEKTTELCRQLAERMGEYEFDAVIGPAYGGIVLAYEVARYSGKSFIFTQRKDEAMTIRSGFDLSQIKTAIIIEDIITTGGSVKEVIKCALDTGIAVTAVGAIVDRSGGKVDFGCDLVSLLTLDIPTMAADECQLCKEGIALTKPGRSDK